MELLYRFSTYKDFEKTLPEIESCIEKLTHKSTPILFSMREAVNNAIEHGTKKQPALFIHLSISVKEHQLIINITDEGSGFNYEEKLAAVEDPDTYLKNHLASIRGRGIAIMKKCANVIKYGNEGKKLTLIYYLE